MARPAGIFVWKMSEDAPPPAADEIQIDVEWCGICGTDVEEYTSGPLVIPTTPHPLTHLKAPMIIGHEVAGRRSTNRRQFAAYETWPTGRNRWKFFFAELASPASVINLIFAKNGPLSGCRTRVAWPSA